MPWVGRLARRPVGSRRMGLPGRGPLRQALPVRQQKQTPRVVRRRRAGSDQSSARLRPDTFL